MSEFWKSIPKIHCKYCNVWYQDNKSSKEFHERSFKHKSNIDRHISDVQQRSVEEKRKEDEHRIEMQRIERAAMAAYEKDLAGRPSSRPTDLAAAKAEDSPPARASSADGSSNQRQDEAIASKVESEKTEKKGAKLSDDLMRKQALEAVTSKLKKKNEWFESKTIEGQVYYYNRTTMETKWTAPKSGFVSIGEQKEMNISDVPGDQSRPNDGESDAVRTTFKHEQFNSKWQVVADEESHLQLPSVQVKRKALDKDRDDDDTGKIEFNEKILDKELTLFKKKDKDVGFKKRKFNTANRRARTDD